MIREYKGAYAAVVVTGLAFVVNFIITMYLTPYITKNIGTESWGYVKLAKDIAQYCTYITVCLNAMATRFISISYHEKDKAKANRYFNSVFFGDIILGSMIVLGGVILIWNIDKVFHVSPELVSDVRILFLFTFLKFWQTTVFSAFECGAMIKDKLYVTGFFKFLSYMAEAVVLLFLYHLLDPRIFYVGIALFVSAIVVSVSNIYITKKYTPQMVIDRKAFSFSAMKELMSYGIWSSFNLLGSFLNNGLDLMITNWMLTARMMGQLAIAQSITSIFLSLVPITMRPFQPVMLKAYAKNDIKETMRHMYMAIKVSSFFTCVGFAGFISLGMCFYKLWIPTEDTDMIYKLTIVAILPCVSLGIVSPGFFAYSLTLRRVIPCVITFISGIANVCSMYILIKYTGLGVFAVVWTTAVISTTANLIVHPYYITKVMGVSWREFMFQIGRALLSCAIMTGVFWLIARALDPERWFTFIASAAVLTIPGVIVHAIIVLDREELGKIVQKIAQKNHTERRSSSEK